MDHFKGRFSEIAVSENYASKTEEIAANTEDMLKNKKIRLFAEKSTVVQISWAQSVSVTATESGIVTRRDEFKAGDLKKAFLKTMDDSGMKYEIIDHGDTDLTFAVGRQKVEEIGKMINEFHSDARRLALVSRSVLQAFNSTPLAFLKDKVLCVLDSKRRDVNKAVERLNNG